MLATRLTGAYPGSKHVAEMGLDRAIDRKVWSHAKQNDLAIVSKDSDFSEMSVLRGFPPNIVWIRCGNCTTDEIEEMLRESRDAVERLGEDAETGVLILH